MSSSKTCLYIGGFLVLVGGGLAIWMNRDSIPNTPKRLSAPEVRSGRQDNQSVVKSLEGPLAGVIEYDYVTCEYPEEGIVRSVGHLQNPIIDYETAGVIPPEQVEKWTAPKIYYGSDDEFRHVYFNSGIPRTYSLRSLAEKKMVEKYGLAIAENGYPEDVDTVEFSKKFLRGSMKYWEIGGTISPREIALTPVVVEVVGIGEPTAEKRDGSLIGQKIPMLLVVKSAPFINVGEGVVIRTNSKIDLTDPKDLYRRSWLLLPYVEQKYKGEIRLPPVSGYVAFDEPSLEAWEKLKNE